MEGWRWPWSRGYDAIPCDVVESFRRQAKELSCEALPWLAYFHIPRHGGTELWFRFHFREWVDLC